MSVNSFNKRAHFIQQIHYQFNNKVIKSQVFTIL